MKAVHCFCMPKMNNDNFNPPLFFDVVPWYIELSLGHLRFANSAES